MPLPTRFRSFFSNFIILCFFLSVLSPGDVYAGFLGPGMGVSVSTTAEALAAADDSPCTLEGNIIAKITGRKNRYLFKDSSGEIVVEIKKKVFGSLTVTPDNLVRLEGEVDWNSKHPNEVEVDELFILK